MGIKCPILHVNRTSCIPIGFSAGTPQRSASASAHARGEAHRQLQPNRDAMSCSACQIGPSASAPRPHQSYARLVTKCPILHAKWDQLHPHQRHGLRSPQLEPVLRRHPWRPPVGGVQEAAVHVGVRHNHKPAIWRTNPIPLSRKP
jgi:hypothetical protein